MEQFHTHKNIDIDYDLVSYISHETKGPFNGLIGFSDLLCSHYDKLSDENRKEYLTVVNQLASKSFLQLQVIIYWVKLMSNNIKPHLGICLTTDLLKQVMLYTQNDIDAKGIELTVNHSILNVNTDSNQLSVVLANILTTAIRTSKEESEISLDLSETPAGNYEIAIKWASDKDTIAPYLDFSADEPNHYNELAFKPWLSSRLVHLLKGDIKWQFEKTNASVLITLTPPPKG